MVRHHQVGLEAHLGAEAVALGQAPAGALNENSRGSISSMVKPDTGHANRAENVMRSWVSFLLWSMSLSALATCPLSLRAGRGLG